MRQAISVVVALLASTAYVAHADYPPYVVAGGQPATNLRPIANVDYSSNRGVFTFAPGVPRTPYIWDLGLQGTPNRACSSYSGTACSGAGSGVGDDLGVWLNASPVEGEMSLTTWAATTSYAAGVVVQKGVDVHNLYWTQSACTSGSTGPTGTGNAIADGTCTWSWLPSVLVDWQASTTYHVGDMVARRSAGRVYQVVGCGNGASSCMSAGSGGPTGISEAISDGGVFWRFVRNFGAPGASIYIPRGRWKDATPFTIYEGDAVNFPNIALYGDRGKTTEVFIDAALVAAYPFQNYGNMGDTYFGDLFINSNTGNGSGNQCVSLYNSTIYGYNSQTVANVTVSRLACTTALFELTNGSQRYEGLAVYGAGAEVIKAHAWSDLWADGGVAIDIPVGDYNESTLNPSANSGAAVDATDPAGCANQTCQQFGGPGPGEVHIRGWRIDERYGELLKVGKIGAANIVPAWTVEDSQQLLPAAADGGQGFVVSINSSAGTIRNCGVETRSTGVQFLLRVTNVPAGGGHYVIDGVSVHQESVSAGLAKVTCDGSNPTVIDVVGSTDSLMDFTGCAAPNIVNITRNGVKARMLPAHGALTANLLVVDSATVAGAVELTSHTTPTPASKVRGVVLDTVADTVMTRVAEAGQVVTVSYTGGAPAAGDCLDVSTATDGKVMTSSGKECVGTAVAAGSAGSVSMRLAPTSGGTVYSLVCGTGLTGGSVTTSGTCAADFGTGAGKVTQGNDTRLPPTPSVSGNTIKDTGSAYVTAVPSSLISWQPRWSITEAQAGGLITSTNALGDTTTGVGFWFTNAGTALGVRFPWMLGSAATVTCKLRNAAHSTVASGTVNTTGAGIYKCLFGTPLTVTDSLTYQRYTMTLHDGGSYTYLPDATWTAAGGTNEGSSLFGFDGFFPAPWQYTVKQALSDVGDVDPATETANNHYPMDLIWQGN